MTLNEYQEATQRTAIYPHDPPMLGLWYTILGLVNESGELAGKAKKILRDQGGQLTEETKTAMIEEAGDMLWYLASFLREINVPLDFVAEQNLSKLQSRQHRGVLKGSGDHR